MSHAGHITADRESGLTAPTGVGSMRLLDFEFMKNYKDEYDEYERPPRRKRYIQCSDRMCGAEDCSNCRPENFRGGVYVDDPQPDEP
jgi:hypothetical protein